MDEIERLKLLSDDEKIKALETLGNDYAKAQVIVTLQDDDKKIKALETLIYDYDKVEVIITLQDDDRKIKTLETLRNDYAKAEVIITLQDDDRKIKTLETLRNDYAKAEVIITLQDDDKKIKALETLSDEIIRTIIIETLHNKSLKDSLLNNRNTLKENLLKENRLYTEIGLDSRITIGMEIESEGAMSPLIETLIAQKNRNRETIWNAEGDDSLEEGIELVSPILTDSKEDIEDIYIVCSFLKKCGQRISERCGGHIHIGADYLTSKEAYVNLFEIWGNAEKIICKMSNEIGTIPRMGLQEYATPISAKLNEAIESETITLESDEDLEQFISDMQGIQDSRYSGLNLLNINNGKNTIEFRISNGTINPDTWIENARLYGRIVQISQRLSEIEKQPEHSKEDERLLSLKERLKEEIPEQDKMEILLELLFSEEERKVYRERYISSSKLLAQISDEKNPFQNMKFNQVAFKKKKHSLDEFHDVAVNNRIEAINEATRETLQGAMTEDVLRQANDINMEGK